MANPLRGEVPFVVGEQTFTLRLAANELVEAEALLDKGVQEIADMLNNPATFRLGAARALVFAGLKGQHPEVTLLSVGELIGEVGIPYAVAKLGESLQAAFPPAEAGAKNPPANGQDGTGNGS